MLIAQYHDLKALTDKSRLSMLIIYQDVIGPRFSLISFTFYIVRHKWSEYTSAEHSNPIYRLLLTQLSCWWTQLSLAPTA